VKFSCSGAIINFVVLTKKMGNLIVGLRYQPPLEKVETEEQLLDTFYDLRKNYERLWQFEILDRSSNPIKDFRHFLEVAIKDKLTILRGSGDIGGLEVHDANVEYDLSSIEKLTRYWDIHRDGSCHNCHNLGREYDLGDFKWCCAIGINPMIWHDCPKYDSLLKNREGKLARQLVELIEEATSTKA